MTYRIGLRLAYRAATAAFCLFPLAALAQPISQLPPIPSVSAQDFTIMVVPGSPNVDYRATVAQIFTAPTIAGPVTVTGDLTASGAGSFATLTVGGNPIGGGGSGNTPGNFTTLAVSGDSTLTGALSVGGTATLSGPLTVSGALNGSTANFTSLTVGGNPIGGGSTGAFTSLSVSGVSTLSGGLVVGSPGATFNGPTGIAGTLSVNGNFGAAGISNLAVTNVSTLNASGVTTLSGGLVVGSAGATINGNTGIVGSLSTSGNFGAAGTSNIGVLDATSGAFSSNLTVNGTLNVGTAGIGVQGSILAAGTITANATINTAQYQAGGTNGVTCSGPPTGSYQTSVGIVIHC
jgi:hypothetical protein